MVTDFLPSDIAKVVAGVLSSTAVFAGAGAGIPSEVNTVGAYEDAGDFYLAFDVPVTSGGTDFFPGQVVRFQTSTGLSLYWSDPSFPSGSVMTGLSLPVAPTDAPGAVPDGNATPGTPLTASKGAVGQVSLVWGASCSDPDDYSVYEGAIGSWANHVSSLCTTSGSTSTSITPDNGDRYFIIVPHNGAVEGSYGVDSLGQWRPGTADPSACAGVRVVRNCP